MNVASNLRREARLYLVFRITLWGKGLIGLTELFTALVVMFVPSGWWLRAAVGATQHELIEDPHDPVALWIVSQAHSLAGGTQWFVFLYLLVHALTKIVLVVAVLKDKLWAYPWMIGFLGIFIVYQTYRVFTTGSIPMLLLTIFDVFMLWLTWHEWQRHKRRSRRGRKPSESAVLPAARVN